MYNIFEYYKVLYITICRPPLPADKVYIIAWQSITMLESSACIIAR